MELWSGAAGVCAASGVVTFVLDDSSGAAVCWVLSIAEFPFAREESAGTGATLGVDDVPGVVSVVVVGVVFVVVAGAGVASGATTGVVGLASVSELVRLHPAKARGRLIERRAARN